MNLGIYAERKISEVQEEFSRQFPYLKIEFFKNGQTQRDRYPAHLIISRENLLKTAWWKNKREGLIDVLDNMTVAELENTFMDDYGLIVQVFRRSGNLWLETTMTDGWTLHQQNEHGKEISSPQKSW